MKKTPLFIITLLAALITFGSCKEDSTIGSSVIQDEVTVVIDSTFTVTGKSLVNSHVQSRTIAQLIGRIDAHGYGRLSSDVVTQFMPSASIDTLGVTEADVDSLLLVLGIAKGEFIGDSVAPLGLTIYPLTKELPSPIFSNFDPTDYYDATTKLATKVYNLSNRSADTVYSTGLKQIRIRMPKAMGQKLFREYKANPAAFSSPTDFAKIFPGIYIKNSFGSGALARVTSTMMSLYYHRHGVSVATGKDTIYYNVGNYFAVTPEVITNNNITFDISPDIQARVDKGQEILMAPAGLDVEMRFPVPEILASFHAKESDLAVVNTLSLSIPASLIDNNYNLVRPPYILMVLSKDKEKFYANNSLPDNITSFYATLNTTTGTYDFSDMRSYIVSLINKKDLSSEDYTFTLTPVSVLFEQNSSSYYYQTSTTLSSVTPYMAAPVMAQLHLDKAKIKFTFTLQTIEK